MSIQLLLLLLLLLATVSSVFCASASSTLVARTSAPTGLYDKRSIQYYVNGARFFKGDFSKLELEAAMLSNYVYDMTTPMPCELLMWSRVLIPTVNDEIGFFQNVVTGMVAIVFQGTEGWFYDYVSNFDAFKVPMVGVSINGLEVHDGFQREYRMHIGAITNFISKYPGARILITGHSKGGAVSNLCAFDLSYRQGLANRIEHISFASPRVGNRVYCDWVDRTVQKNTRFVTANECLLADCLYVDPITLVPVEISGYSHNGNRKIVRSTAYWKHPILEYIGAIKKGIRIHDTFTIGTPKFTHNGVLFVEIYMCYGKTVSANVLSLPYSQVVLPTQHVKVSNYEKVSWNTNNIPASTESNEYLVQFWINENPYISTSFELPTPSCPENSLKCSNGIATLCKEGFYGPYCNLLCPGKCRNCTIEGSCGSCEAGWSNKAKNCLEPICKNCTGYNQRCVAPDLCTCRENWNGTRCDIPICPITCKSCLAPTICTTCISGKFGTTCQYDCMPNCEYCTSGTQCSRCYPEWQAGTCQRKKSRPVYRSGTDYSTSTVLSLNSVATNELFLPVTVSASYSFAMFITEDSKLFALGVQVPYSTSATSLPSLTAISPISPFFGNYISVSPAGDLMLGNIISGASFNAGIYNTTYGYKRITGFGNITSGIIGNEYSFIISNHTLYGLGFDRLGFLSLGTLNAVINDYRPILSNVLTCNCDPQGTAHVICIMLNNDIYGFGDIQRGYYGYSSSGYQYTPVKLDKGPYMANAKLVQVLTSASFSLFLDSEGLVYVSGASGPAFSGTGLYPRLFNSGIWNNERILRMSYSNGAVVFTTHSGRGLTFGSTSYSRFTGAVTTYTQPMEFFMTPKAMFMIERRVCSNMMDIDPRVCSGRGNCTEIGKCTCEQPWVGANCDEFTCFGVRSGNVSVCSRNGACVDFDTCVCQEGYSGPKCDPICPSNCSSCTTPFLCTKCSDGYYGVDLNCAVPCPLNCEKCSDTGVCEVCALGWSGSNCTAQNCPIGCLSCSSPDRCLECEAGLYGDSCDSVCPYGCQKCLGPDLCSKCNEGWSGPSCSVPICMPNCSSCEYLTNCSVCVAGRYGSQCENSCLENCESCSASDQCDMCKPGWTGTTCQAREKSECGYQLLSESPELSEIFYDNEILGMVVVIPNAISASNISVYVGTVELTNCNALNDHHLMFDSMTDLCSTSLTIKRNVTEILLDPSTETILDPSGLFWTAKFPVNIAYVLSPSLNYGVCRIENYQLVQTVQLMLDGGSSSLITIDSSDLAIILRQEVISIRNSRLYVKFSLLSEEGMMIEEITSLPIENPSFTITKLPSAKNEFSVEVLSTFESDDYTATYLFRLRVSDHGSEAIPVQIPLKLRYKLPIPPPTIIETLFTKTTFYKKGMTENSVFATSEKPNLVVSLESQSGVGLPETLHITINNAFLCCMNDSNAPMPQYDPALGLLGCTVRNTSMTVWEQLVINSEMSQSAFAPQVLNFNDNERAGISFSASPLGNFVVQGVPLLCYVHIQSKVAQTAARRIHAATKERTLHSYNLIHFEKEESAMNMSRESKVITILAVLFGSIAAICCVLVLIVVILAFKRRKAKSVTVLEPTAVHLRDFVGILPIDLETPSDSQWSDHQENFYNPDRIHIPQIR